ncbi:hypothetical protein [Profundibacter amoris]|uniref:Uncharacterized protein n=1 Tax=Profundibacter amoris TaxID=2171755 RepID=A0A347UKP3_9RHOB|nr:hypothetical protein [Profundibacter amoris]AXX99421.1 hypothetical protein BAR1_16665 [Profundibacter amoris]
MLKPRSISFATIVALLPVTFAFLTIIYILLGTNGRTWASAPLETGFYLAIGLNLACYISALIHRSTQLFITNLVISFLIILTFFGAVATSFPETGSRYNNHGLSGVASIGVICAILIFVQNIRWAWSIAIAMSLAILVVPVTAYYFISKPLYTVVRETDLSKTCLIQTPTYEYNYNNSHSYERAQRIYSIEDLTLGILIGEHSPRIIEISGMQARQWSYSGRRFGRSYSLVQPPVICASDIPKAN